MVRKGVNMITMEINGEEIAIDKENAGAKITDDAKKIFENSLKEKEIKKTEK